MRIIDTITRWLFAVSLAFVLLTGSIALVTNSAWFYNWGFHQNNVTFLVPDQLDKSARGLISYFNSADEYIDLTVVRDGRPFQLFNEQEIDHLKDVKALFRLDYLVLFIALIVCLAYVGYRTLRRESGALRDILRGVVRGSGLTLALMLLMGIGSLTNFSALFLQFHFLSFSNLDWQLQATDSLILMFPEPFWQAAAILIALGAAVAAIILGGLALVRLKRLPADR